MSRRPPPTTLLVSCAVCRRLHEPLRPLAENPMCGFCAAGEHDEVTPAEAEDAEREF